MFTGWCGIILALSGLFGASPVHHHPHRCIVVSRTIGAALGSTVEETVLRCGQHTVTIDRVIAQSDGNEAP
jgi:hypothetical protein